MENLSTEFDGKELLQQTIYIIGLNPPANAGDLGSALGGELPWRRTWQPTPVLLPGESHVRGLVGHKELDLTERTHTCV